MAIKSPIQERLFKYVYKCFDLIITHPLEQKPLHIPGNPRMLTVNKTIIIPVDFKIKLLLSWIAV